MTRLSDTEKTNLLDLIKEDKFLPPVYKGKLFAPDDGTFIEATKEYRLVYEGKARREDVIAGTPEAPFQLTRKFSEDNPFPDGWRNMLIYGDNLVALKELYADQSGPNLYGTRDRIKLIYIDPPFATKADFMKDKEKAYRDKVIGAQFLEFLRRRLFLLHEILADDGAIYVHLDWKKGHYVKAILDEVFGEHNFLNEVVWTFDTSGKGETTFYRKHHTLFFYAKNKRAFRFNGKAVAIPRKLGTAHLRFGIDDQAREYYEDFSPRKSGKKYRWYLDEGVLPPSYWSDLGYLNPSAEERTRYAYPTQKPERLLERCIKSATWSEKDIVLDAFAGSGTAAAVSEKLGRRWIAIDCGRLAIYTTQKRLLELKTNIGPVTKDESLEYERTDHFDKHLKASPALLMITEKARRGEAEITLELLKDFARLIKRHDLAKNEAPISLVCGQTKLKVPEGRVLNLDNGDGVGQRRITVGGVEFRVSFVDPRKKVAKSNPLKAKEFALFSAGVYDNEAVKQMPWAEYRPFVLKLFQVREHEHSIKGLRCDGYVRVHSAFVWNYPDQKKLTIDYDYVKSIHNTIGDSAGERLYIIAPIVSMGFAEDEYRIGATTYVFLKVPISILTRLLQSGEMGALKQPTNEADVNEVIDAVGFDFSSQPEAQWRCRREPSPDAASLKDYVIYLTEFRSKTLATDPQDFANFETFSMAMVDTDYDGNTFTLDKVFWADDLITDELKRLKDAKRQEATSEQEEGGSSRLSVCERLSLRVRDKEFRGKQMMVILCDRYGNEKKLLFTKSDFR